MRKTGDMTSTNDQPGPLSLGAKLLVLLRLRRDPQGFIPSAREVADSTKGAESRGSALSHATVNGLMNGTSTNPTSSTLVALADALGAPVPFLLPGWDDLTALTVFEESPGAREVLRLLQGLEMQDIEDIVKRLREVRRQRGLPAEVPALPPPPAGVDQPRDGRPRRRLSFNEAAERAADDLEGR